jgi:hypothetical protein
MVLGTRPVAKRLRNIADTGANLLVRILTASAGVVTFKAGMLVRNQYLDLIEGG